ncbi:hypothetical protein E0H80_16375 [Acinetobacter sp. ANC 4779]|uniref:hypothetical protein n=1 Tax=Acinetobacter sp. ANC 4779 TaxID=2529848 RepID=UPI001040C783|nr:hypothetical protein [Acinetobacter sp. ANC 4779]TCB47367.1 hypothetical protein E0H80_16375 [Acinetobacter sp. ANC 4779]
MSILSWDDFEDPYESIAKLQEEMEKPFQKMFARLKKINFLRRFLKMLGQPYATMHLKIKEIRQYINRYLFIFLREEYSPKTEKASLVFNRLAFKQQQKISPNILFITTRNFSIQKNLSISA